MKLSIEEINRVLDGEIEFVKGCGMPQFVMGIQQAKKTLNNYVKDLKDMEE